jgi:putative transposase
MIDFLNNYLTYSLSLYKMSLTGNIVRKVVLFIAKTLSEFSDKERQQAYKRYKIIKPYFDDAAKLNTIATENNVSYSTLSRWVRKYRTDGLIGLIDKKRTDNGKRRVISDEFRLFIEGLALQKPKPSIASIHRKAIEVAKSNNWNVPSYRTVSNIVKSINPAIITLALEGSKEYKNKYDLLFPRKSSRPNEIWQADHSLLDIWLIDDKAKHRRPWLTIIIDDFSRVITGYYLTFESPNTQNTSLTLRQAIWYKEDPRWYVCGIPETFYTDHGSDFTSLHMEQVSANIKMSLSFSLAGQPQGRGIIERFFSTINQLFLCELPGYMPNGKYPEKPPTMEINGLEALLKKFIIENYNYRVHSETEMAPYERWKTGGFIPRLPDSLEELDLLLFTVAKPRKVHKDGIHFQSLKYMDITLAAYVGEEVIIRYDPRDIAEIRVFHENAFLCRAICYELSNQNVSLKDIIRARNRRRKELKREIDDRNDVVQVYLEQPKYENSNIETANTTAKVEKKRKLKRFFNE